MAVELVNTTGWPVFGFAHVLLEERPYYIVIVKQTWQLLSGGGKQPVAKQREVRVGDRFQGRPNHSAIALPTDLVPYKPHGEIIVCGHAHAAQPLPSWDVEVALGEWSKRLRVFGARTWHKSLLGWKLSDALPTQQARLDYAAAYGGHFELPAAAPDQEPLVVSHRLNPGGCGWLGKGHGTKLTRPQREALQRLGDTAEVQACAIERPQWLSRQRPPGHDLEPVAFGALPAWSEQRLSYLRGMKPPKPDAQGYGADFDMDHWQQAAKDQWLPKEWLPGGALHLRGVFDEGDVVYRVPRPQTLVVVRSRKRLNAALETDIDTLVVDADERLLEVVERRLVSLDEFGADAAIEVVQRARR